MRQEKKSETLEVRVSLSEKSAFAARAAARGESMSAALRRLIAEDAVPRLVSKEAPMRTRLTFASAPVVLTILILATVSLVGAEADPRTDFKGNFRGKDANRDGILDRDELIAVMTHRIAEADVPAVCKGTQWEERWNATPEMLADGHMEFYDGNGDGVATLSEYISAYEAKRGTEFVEADADGSGYVDAQEMVAAYKVDEAKIHTECRAAIGMHGSETVPEIIEFLDIDRDGKVSMREFMDH